MKQNVEEINKIAEILSTQSQLNGQYFQLGSLFLVNVTLNNDAAHFWEYEIYKCDDKGNAYKFESYTVNSSSDSGREFAAFLHKYEEIHYREFRDPFTDELVFAHEKDIIPAEHVKWYKKYFDQHAFGNDEIEVVDDGK